MSAAETKRGTVPPDHYPGLKASARIFHDLQTNRKGILSRIRQADIDPAYYEPTAEAIRIAEREAKKNLIACYRLVVEPQIIEWQQSTRNIGEHTLALLLGEIGHPVIARTFMSVGTGESRTLVFTGMKTRRVSDLWSYCGHGAPSKRRRGMTVEEALACGSPAAKTAVWKLATAQVKEVKRFGENPYRHVYDEMRDRYDDTHPEWTNGHQQAAAIRVVGKEILRDLWRVAQGLEPWFGHRQWHDATHRGTAVSV